MNHLFTFIPRPTFLAFNPAETEAQEKKTETTPSYFSSVIPLVSSAASYGFNMLNDLTDGFDPYAGYEENEIENAKNWTDLTAEVEEFRDIPSSDDESEELIEEEKVKEPQSFISTITSTAATIGSFGIKSAIFLAGAGGGNIYGTSEDDDAEEQTTLQDRVTLVEEVYTELQEAVQVAKEVIIEKHEKADKILKVIINTPKKEAVIRDPKLVELEKEILKMAFPIAGQAAGLLESVVEHVWSPLSGIYKPVFGTSQMTDLLDGGLVTGFIKTTIQEQKETLLNKLVNGESTLLKLIPSNAPIKKVNVATADQSNIFVRMVKKIVNAVIYVFRAIGNFFYAVAKALRLVNGPQITIKTPQQATNDRIRLLTDNITPTLKVAGLWAWAGQKVSNIFSSAVINHSLKLIREQVFGDQNSQKMKTLLDKMEDTFILKLTEELAQVNRLLSPDIDDSLVASTISPEEKVLNKLSENAKLHSAIPYLSAAEDVIIAKRAKLLPKESALVAAIEAKKEEIKKANDKLEETIEKLQTQANDALRVSPIAEDIIMKAFNSAVEVARKKAEIEDKKLKAELAALEKQKPELYAKTIEENKVKTPIAIKQIDVEIALLEKEKAVHVRNGNPTKVAEWTIKISDANTAKPLEIARINAEDALIAQEILGLQAIDKKLANTENDYFRKLATDLLDNVLFPDGIPSNFKNLLWVAGFAVDAKYKDARSYILNELTAVLSKAVNDNLGNPQKLEGLLDKLLVKLPVANAQIIKDRLKMTKVNKHIVFSVLDELIKTAKT